MDGEGQLVDAVAAIFRGQPVVERVSAGNCRDVDVAVPLPYVGLVVAGLGSLCKTVGRMDGEGQLVDAVAAARRGQPVVERISAGNCRDGDVAVSSPYVWDIVTGLGSLGETVGRMYREGQLVGAVAAVFRGQSVVERISAGSCRDGDVAVSSPYVWDIVTGLGSLGETVGRVNGKREYYGTVTAVDGTEVALVLCCARLADQDIKAVSGVTFALADCGV